MLTDSSTLGRLLVISKAKVVDRGDPSLESAEETRPTHGPSFSISSMILEHVRRSSQREDKTIPGWRTMGRNWRVKRKAEMTNERRFLVAREAAGRERERTVSFVARIYRGISRVTVYSRLFSLDRLFY